MAQLVIASSVWSGAEMTDLLGPSDEPVESRGDIVGLRGGIHRVVVETSWILSSKLEGSAWVESHLDSLYGRVGPAIRELMDQPPEHVSSLLCIVQFMSSADEQGHGISIGSEWITLLERLNGVVDIDQYVVNDDGGGEV